MPSAPDAIALPGATPKTTTDSLYSVRSGTRVTNTLEQPGVEPPPATTVDPLPTIEEVPGHLGRRRIPGTTQVLLSQAARRSSTQVLVYPRNHRFRGHREAAKFLLPLQHVLAMSGSLFLSLKEGNTTLQTSEAVILPTVSEVALVYHLEAQLAFHEWNLLRDVNTNWFE